MFDGVLALQNLEQAGRLPDAAVAFLACDSTEDAIRCYEHAGEWKMAFALLLQSKPDATRIRTLGLSLVDHLKVLLQYEYSSSHHLPCYVDTSFPWNFRMPRRRRRSVSLGVADM